MRQSVLTIFCALLAVLCLQGVLSATVRPYKFGFTIEEQQHRAEKRDENGIVMGEFGFITADGIYHVTVYATDENGKFHIISMKNYPYAGPVTPKLQAAAAPPTTTTTTQRTTSPALPKHNFNTAACSGCFLSKTPVVEKDAPPTGNRSPKTEIRPLSQPLAPSSPGGKFQDQLVAAATGHSTQAQTLIHSSNDLATLPSIRAENEYIFDVPISNVPALPAGPTTTTPAPTTTEEPEVIRNHKAVALAHELDKVNAQRPTRPTTAPAANPVAAASNLATLARIPAPTTTEEPEVIRNHKAVALAHELDKVNAQRPTRPTTAPAANPIAAASNNLATLARIPPATVGRQDVNNYAFVAPQEFASPLRPTSYSKAESINTEVVSKMEKVALPLAQAVASVLNRQPQPTPTRSNRITAASPSMFPTFIYKTQPATQAPQQHTQTTTPAHTQSASYTRPLIVQSGQQPVVGLAGQQPGSSSTTGNAGQQPAPNYKPAVTTYNTQQSLTPQQQTGSSSNPSFKPSVSKVASTGLPTLTANKPGQPPAGNSFTSQSSSPTKTGAIGGQSGDAGLTGDLYKFKYLLDYNGHEETGSRNGDKQGNYFAIGDDAIERTVEYIANEFGFQPHISWRKLEGNEAVLPEENTLKHYEFKWFNKE